MRRLLLCTCAGLIALASACTPHAPAASSPASTPPVTPTAMSTPPPSPTSTATAAATRMDIRASRLVIPALGIDAPVGLSRVVPDTSVPLPGCPAPPPGQTTLTVPDRGIVTPEEPIEGLENKAWIFGHSRWAGQPGILSRLHEINPGDEVVVDGMVRQTGERVTARRFAVDGIYLTDIDSGGRLVAATTPAEIPAMPLVILQTSVRESGANRPWILDRARITAKARSLIEGDVDDPCKYLLLFVVARPA